VFIINNDQSITFLGHIGPLNNFLGTHASQHCNNTLFKMGVHNLGCYMRSTMRQGAYTREMKEVRACTLEESHGDLSVSWFQVPKG
jgi:hypothetical protein